MKIKGAMIEKSHTDYSVKNTSFWKWDDEIQFLVKIGGKKLKEWKDAELKMQSEYMNEQYDQIKEQVKIKVLKKRKYEDYCNGELNLFNLRRWG